LAFTEAIAGAFTEAFKGAFTEVFAAAFTRVFGGLFGETVGFDDLVDDVRFVFFGCCIAAS
jgi:hypothetical protein